MKVPSGGIYNRLGCGVSVSSVCVYMQIAAMFLFQQKCDLASGFHGYWFEGEHWFGVQDDVDVGS